MSCLKSSAGPRSPKVLACLSIAPPCAVPFCSSPPHSAWASGSQWRDIVWACLPFLWLSHLLFSLPEMCFPSLFGRHTFAHLSKRALVTSSEKFPLLSFISSLPAPWGSGRCGHLDWPRVRWGRGHMSPLPCSMSGTGFSTKDTPTKCLFAF